MHSVLAKLVCIHSQEPAVRFAVVLRRYETIQTEFHMNGDPRRSPIPSGPSVFYHATVSQSSAIPRRSGQSAARMNPSHRLCQLAAAGFLLGLLLAGCQSPTVRQQRLVAKPNMTFSDSAAFSYNSPRLLGQFATGLVVFFEWFAVWCPYCVAAVPQVEIGIVDWYEARGGNPHGCPSFRWR